MTEQQIINELDSIIAYADGLKDKAAGLRRKLERLNAPTSRKRAKKISDETIAMVLAGRQKFLNKKAMRQHGHI